VNEDDSGLTTDQVVKW